MSTEAEKLLNDGDTEIKDGEVKPYRVQLNLTTAHMDPKVVEEMLDGLLDDAEFRGFINEAPHGWSFMGEMNEDEVIAGSELDKIVQGVDDGEEGGDDLDAHLGDGRR